MVDPLRAAWSGGGPTRAASREERALPLSRGERILDLAFPLFLQHGFEGVSMSMIASAVGGSKATLYSYFPTKADLFVALMERAWVRQGSEEPPPITCNDARGWIAHAVEDYLRHLYSEEVLALHRLLIAEAARFPELGRRMYEAGPAQGLARLSGSLTQLARHGLICCETPVAAARQLRALAKSEHYDALLWCALDPPGREEIARHSDHVAATFLALHGAPSASQPTFRASTGRRTGDPSSNEGE